MIANFTSADVPDQSGKTFFITGANTGIGFEAAKVFAGKGGRVLLGCRNPEKGEEALARIDDAYPGADIALVQIDLSDLTSVRAAARRVAHQTTTPATAATATVRATSATESVVSSAGNRPGRGSNSPMTA